MADILFMMWPEPGHLNPTFRIAKTLKSHGHRMLYAQLYDFEDYIRAQGFEFVPFFGDLVPKGYQTRRNYSVSIHGDLTELCDRLAAKQHKSTIKFMKEVVESIFERVKPHMVLIDTYNAKFLMPDGPAGDLPCILLNPIIIEPYRNQSSSFLTSLTTLILCPREFELPQLEWPANLIHVEASCDMERKVKPGFPWDRIDESKKLLYCSLGTQGHWQYDGADYEAKQQSGLRFLQAVVTAMGSREDWQLVMVVGHHISPNALHSVPPNAVLVDEAPQSQLLKRASLAITHGGLNTVKDCILLGVPMLVFPIWGDQFGTALRVAFHGLGLTTELRTATAESISSMITTVENDPGLKSRVEAMRQVFLQRENENRAAKIIEKQLAESVKARSVGNRLR
jgi:UDP:flavonoid glycosyltransferase YjiC (YdhE family)